LPQTPATKEYWTEFYVEGEGRGQTFEWYLDAEIALRLFKKYLKRGDKILHIGCGNSTLAEKILQDKQFPEELTIVNVDICETVIERMKSRTARLLSQNYTRHLTRASRRRLRTFRLEQIEFHAMDVCHMHSLSDQSFDIVLDKGMLDALLSTGENETFDNAAVIALNKEVFRVLKNGGKYLIISGNDSFITLPYFCGDPTVYWELEKSPIQLPNKRLPQHQQYHTYFFYVLTSIHGVSN